MGIPEQDKELKFRTAGSSKDAEEIYRMIREAFADYGSGDDEAPALDETLEDVINDIEENTVLIAEKDGLIVASLRLELREGGRYFLKRFAVRPGYQGEGIGTRIFRAAEKLVAERGGEKIYLLSSLEDEGLVNFYEKLGFKCRDIDHRRGYSRGHWEKEIK